MALLVFAAQHPVLALLFALIVAATVTAPFRYAFLAYNRGCRSRNIVAQGWPPNYLDADGDRTEPPLSDTLSALKTQGAHHAQQ